MKKYIILLAVPFLFYCGQHAGHMEKSSQEPVQTAQSFEADTAAACPSIQENFEKQVPGKLPENWVQDFTGRGSGTHWEVKVDNGNHVLAQLSGHQPNYHFNLAVYSGARCLNPALSVRFKAVKGRKDQGGGLVWRYLDRNHYYVVRANPLEDNVVLYKVVNGRRTDLPVLGKGRTYGVKVEPLGKKWHRLDVSVQGSLFTVYLDGKELFSVQDSSITRAGLTGLWTKADAVTYFDNFSIKNNR